MPGLSEYKRMSKDDLIIMCQARQIDSYGKTREEMIHDLHEADIQAEQILERPEEGVSASMDRGSGTALRGASTETEPEVMLNIISNPQSGQASTRMPGPSGHSPQMQAALQKVMDTDPVVYLQFLERQAEREREELESVRQHELETGTEFPFPRAQGNAFGCEPYSQVSSHGQGL